MNIVNDHALLLNKFCSTPMDIEVLGFKEPNVSYPLNYKFYSMGKQENFPNKNWADPIRPFIESVKEDYFSFWWDDLFPIRPMRQDLLEEAINLVDSGKAQKVHFFMGSKAQYMTSLPYNDNFNILQQTAEYRSAVAPGIWSKEYFLRHLSPKMSPWDYEIKNMPKTTNDSATILVPKSEPIMGWVNMFRNGKFNNWMWNNYNTSSTGHFAWNKFQQLTPEVAAIVAKYKDLEL